MIKWWPRSSSKLTTGVPRSDELKLNKQAAGCLRLVRFVFWVSESFLGGCGCG
nr:hypothetical protein [Paenibacillus ferrarius]